MKTACRKVLLLISLISLINLGGCTTSATGALPRGGYMSMADIYKAKTGLSMDKATEHERQENISEIRKHLRPGTPSHYANYTRTSMNEINGLFKRLPNPEVNVYVYPHLVQTGSDTLGVPGYSTAFFLYKENHFAMPSEKY